MINTSPDPQEIERGQFRGSSGDKFTAQFLLIYIQYIQKCDDILCVSDIRPRECINKYCPLGNIFQLEVQGSPPGPNF